MRRHYNAGRFLTNIHKGHPIARLYIQYLNSFITEPADVWVPTGARPSAGTVITAKLYTLSSLSFHWLSMMSKLIQPDDVIPNSCLDIMKSCGMSRVNGELHDDVIKWKHFPRYWPFVQGIHRSPVNSLHKWPVTQSFDIFFDLGLNKRLSKQSWGWWFETLSCPLWRHCNGVTVGLEQACC